MTNRRSCVELQPYAPYFPPFPRSTLTPFHSLLLLFFSPSQATLVSLNHSFATLLAAGRPFFSPAPPPLPKSPFFRALCLSLSRPHTPIFPLSLSPNRHRRHHHPSLSPSLQRHATIAVYLAPRHQTQSISIFPSLPPIRNPRFLVVPLLHCTIKLVFHSCYWQYF